MVKSYVPNIPPCTLDELFELVHEGQRSPYQLKGMPMLAEIMPRPAETNAEWPYNPINHTNIMLIALGRVFSLLQGLGGHTQLHKFRGHYPL